MAYSEFYENVAQAKTNIESLLQYANETTGANDTRLGDAIRKLVEGFGSGESKNLFDETITMSSSVKKIEIQCPFKPSRLLLISETVLDASEESGSLTFINNGGLPFAYMSEDRTGAFWINTSSASAGNFYYNGNVTYTYEDGILTIATTSYKVFRNGDTYRVIAVGDSESKSLKPNEWKKLLTLERDMTLKEVLTEYPIDLEGNESCLVYLSHVGTQPVSTAITYGVKFFIINNTKSHMIIDYSNSINCTPDPFNYVKPWYQGSSSTNNQSYFELINGKITSSKTTNNGYIFPTGNELWYTIIPIQNPFPTI